MGCADDVARTDALLSVSPAQPWLHYQSQSPSYSQAVKHPAMHKPVTQSCTNQSPSHAQASHPIMHKPVTQSCTNQSPSHAQASHPSMHKPVT
ncbi:hypothetical protein Pmani_029837 [Petrolisthes manimaculis]|uniref:Uncharacterized protein n=1 Tax=Petrolisthes manimaculis TaxID=1843537 RepID=A0AAE1NYM9_9EUCA|nr:hypothetical protein Pmani_029837 [Petrolisthes manimaculis]